MGFDLAAVAVTREAIVVHEPPLPSAIVFVNGEITQADFASLRNIMDHSHHNVSVRRRGRRRVDVVKSAGVGKAVVVEEGGFWVDAVSSDRSRGIL